MVTASDVLSIANDEIGYIAKKTNSQLDNKTANAQTVKTGYKFTRYARDLFSAGYYNGDKNGYDWCTCFADWCFYVAAGRDKQVAETIKPLDVYGAVVKYAKAAYVRLGRCDNTPRVGDQAFIKFGGELAHTALVLSVGNGTVTTVEGNTSQKINGVEYPSVVRIWTRNMSYFDSFGHPFYGEQCIITKTNEVGQSTLTVPTSVNIGDTVNCDLKMNSGFLPASLQFYANNTPIDNYQYINGVYRASFVATGDSTVRVTGTAIATSDFTKSIKIKDPNTGWGTWQPLSSPQIPQFTAPGNYDFKAKIRYYNSTTEETIYFPIGTQDEDDSGYSFTQKIIRRG